jgi:ElaB/YqjD/DUF883 family membrane-anchored ribosome-binding protein
MAISKKEREIASKVEEKYEEIKDKYQEYRGFVIDYTKKKPVTALAIAAGAGILIGFVCNALRCRK